MARIDTNKLGRTAASAALALLLAVGMSTIPLGKAHAAHTTASVNIESATAQAAIVPGKTATVTTNSDGEARLRVDIAEAGTYSIFSTTSTGANGDTAGFLYDGSSSLIAQNDNRGADTNFCISTSLQAGTYYLDVVGQGRAQGTTITVSLEKATRIGALDCRYSFDESGKLTSIEFGTWVHNSNGSTWSAVNQNAYTVVGYADRQIFAYAAENNMAANIKWKNGLPSTFGSYVLRVDASGSDVRYSGTGYFYLDNACMNERSAGYYMNDLGRKDVQVAYTVCGSVSDISLGWEAVESPNRNSYWTHVSSSYYRIAGYVSRSKLEQTGDPDAVNWTAGLPNQEGEFVIKVTPSNVAKNPYYGTRYIWVSLSDLHHVGTGSWIVDKEATFTTEGSRHLACKFCGGACSVTSIPHLTGAGVGAVVTAGTGSSAAQYIIGKDGVVTYKKPALKKTATTAVVPDTVTINGEEYAVTAIASSAFSGYAKLKSLTVQASELTKIGKNAFKGCKKLKTVTIKCPDLTKKGAKNCLAGSSVTKVKTSKALKADYKAIFTAKNCGKSVTVK